MLGDVELWLDSAGLDKATLGNVLRSVIAKTVIEIPELDIRTANVFMPSDVKMILWRFTLVRGDLGRVTKTLAFWYRYLANQQGTLPEKAKVVLAKEMAARGIKVSIPASSAQSASVPITPIPGPPPAKIVIPYLPKKRWWEFWK